MKKLLLALSLIVLGAPAAHAGFMIEPYLAYQVTGEYKAGSASDDTTGMSFGGRLGYGVLGFSFGVDYESGSNTIELSSGDQDVDTTNLGVFAAYEFPILLRVYAAYLVDSKIELENGNEYSGGGTKFGIGWTGLPFVVIGVEMKTVNYDTDESDSSNNIDADLASTSLVVSIPLP